MEDRIKDLIAGKVVDFLAGKGGDLGPALEA